MGRYSCRYNSYNSYLTSTSLIADSAAVLTASRKEVKYVDMTTTHIFLPLAFDTLGPMFKSTCVLKGTWS